MTSHNPKEAAGRRAAEMVQDGMTIGLGTGSTVHYTLVRLAERVHEEGLTLRGVPTSLDTETKAGQMGIPLAELVEVDTLDLTIDGADEVDPDFQLIKGGGGALLREKVVASITHRLVIVVGREKLVDRLGQGFLLPVEVVPFAIPTVVKALRRLGCEPVIRMADQGKPYVTDNGNEILDCRFPDGIADPRALERKIGSLPGAVENGLFIDLAQVVVIGEEDGGIEVREKPRG